MAFQFRVSLKYIRFELLPGPKKQVGLYFSAKAGQLFVACEPGVAHPLLAKNCFVGKHICESTTNTMGFNFYVDGGFLDQQRTLPVFRCRAVFVSCCYMLLLYTYYQNPRSGSSKMQILHYENWCP